MKWIALAAAGLVATASLAPTPAEAQYRGYGHDRGWNDGRWDRRDDRRWDNRRRDNRRNWNHGWRGDRHWNGRGRVTCRWVRGYYGPVRQCFRR